MTIGATGCERAVGSFSQMEPAALCFLLESGEIYLVTDVDIDKTNRISKPFTAM